MKITKRQLRRIIRESLEDDDDLISALQDTWDQVRLDVGISNPTAEEKSDEAMAMIQTYYPELTQRIAGKSNVEIDELLQRAFGGHN